jgi:hypothetical protein
MAEETAPKSQLRRAMGFWDVLLFNIAAVLGPRWIASAVRRGIIEHRGPRRARFSRDGVAYPIFGNPGNSSHACSTINSWQVMQ